MTYNFTYSKPLFQSKPLMTVTYPPLKIIYYLEKKVIYLCVSEGLGFAAFKKSVWLMQTAESFDLSTGIERLRFCVGLYLIFQNWKGKYTDPLL